MNLHVATAVGYALNETLYSELPCLAAAVIAALLAQVAIIEAGVLP
ncbi:MAG: hypothetical protein WAU52_02855 [Burkholderiales bacterium]